MIMASSNRPIILPNADCVYCGVEFSEFVPFETEHVVARRFVPKGTLDGQWNLLLRSCRRCNGDKSTLENDISAISMQPDASGKFVNADPRLQDEATRKAKRSVSQKTGKPVVLGEEPVKFGGNFGGAKFDFSFSMPPQVNDDRLFRLAHYQIAAFFYWTTFDQTTGRGSFLPGKFRPLVAVRKADWGHPQMRWFIKLTEHWSWRVYGVCAQGYYKIATKRALANAEVWSWALEWNENFRLAGFFGDDQLINELRESEPALNMISIHDAPGLTLRYRQEIPLDEKDDLLFTEPDTGKAGSDDDSA